MRKENIKEKIKIACGIYFFVKRYHFFPIKFIQITLWFLLGINSKLSGQNIIVKPYLQMLDSTSVTIMFETDISTTATISYGNTPFLLNNTINATAHREWTNTNFYRTNKPAISKI